MAQQQYAGDVEVIGVAGRDQIEAVEAFIAQTGVGGFPHIADLDGEIWMEYGVGSQPAFVFIDDDGSVETRLGAMGEAELAATIDALIAT